MPVTLGVLIRPTQSSGGHPNDWPLGRAALALEAEGTAVIFGGRAERGVLVGQRATPNGWVDAKGSVHVVYDRFPALTHPTAWRDLRAALPGIPSANPPALIALCRDKVASQRRLVSRGLPMPELETHTGRFKERLQDWGAGFLKPRFGSFGEGVSRCTAGPSANVKEPILQRAVNAPEGWAGWSVRVNVQREADGRWVANPGALRRHRDDPVVNAARGAEVVAAIDHLPEHVDLMATLARRAARAIADHPEGALLLELGVDFTIDTELNPWLIEVNGRPRGRVASLARREPNRWTIAHNLAAERPLRTLRELVSGDREPNKV